MRAESLPKEPIVAEQKAVEIFFSKHVVVIFPSRVVVFFLLSRKAAFHLSAYIKLRSVKKD